MKKKIDVKLLMYLIIPIFIELVLQILAGNVDKVMVNNDTLATAINQANSILDLLVVALSVLASASLILISQYKGAKDKQKEMAIYKLSFYFNLLIGVIISLILTIFAEPLLRLMQVEGDVLDNAVLYLRITGGFVFVQAMMMSLSSYLRSNELMKQSLIISIVFNVINVGLNAIFLYCTDMDKIISVALGSIIARTTGVILLFIVCIKALHLSLTPIGLFPIKKKELKKIISIGLPSAGEAISYSLSQIVIMSFINIIGRNIELAAPAAKTYASMMVLVSYLFVNSATQGMQILLGRYLGAGEKDLAKRLVWYTTIISIGMSLVIATVTFLLSNQIFSMFTSDKDVIALCRNIMLIDIALELGRAVNMTMVRALQTSGDVMFPTTLAIIFCWLVATLGGYIIGITYKFGIEGIWVAMTIDELFRAGIFIWRFKSGRWMKKNLVTA